MLGDTDEEGTDEGVAVAVGTEVDTAEVLTVAVTLAKAEGDGSAEDDVVDVAVPTGLDDEPGVLAVDANTVGGTVSEGVTSIVCVMAAEGVTFPLAAVDADGDGGTEELGLGTDVPDTEDPTLLEDVGPLV